MASAETLQVEVVYCPAPGVDERVTLTLPVGATLADALAASGLPARHGLQRETLRVGIWSRVRDPATVLRERDRVEIYRPLTVDPKEARRLRYQRHQQHRRG